MLSADGDGREPEAEPEDTLVGPAKGLLPTELELELTLD